MWPNESRQRILELGLVKRHITLQGLFDLRLTIFLLAGVISFATNVAFAANGIGRGDEGEEKHETERHNHQRRFRSPVHSGRRRKKL